MATVGCDSVGRRALLGDTNLSEAIVTVEDEKLFTEEPEIELAAWLVDDGSTVAEGQPIAQVMTAKVTVEVPAPAAGRLRIECQPGQLLRRGGRLGVIISE